MAFRGSGWACNGDFKHNIGGVPLGLKIAEDIFAAGGEKAPAKSPVGPRP